MKSSVSSMPSAANGAARSRRSTANSTGQNRTRSRKSRRAMARNDPYRGFRFRVEFNHVQHGGFARVKGLTRETKVEARREGGLNEYEHKFATLTSYGNLLLERGLADDYLWSWQEDVAEGRIQRKTITIGLHDSTDQEV